MADLKSGKLWFYYERDFDSPIAFDLSAELAKGAHEHRMSDIYLPPPDQGVVTDAGPDTSASLDAAAEASSSHSNGGDGCSLGSDGSSRRRAAWPTLLIVALLAGVLRPRRRECRSLRRFRRQVRVSRSRAGPC